LYLGILCLWHLVEKHAAILGYTHYKIIPQLLAGLPKRVDVAAPVPYIDPLLLLWD
jgi:hypothetical protein